MSEVHGLSGAFAVDALDDVERTEFENHLAVCAECSAEVAELREAAASLSATTELAPPPSLRASVLEGISGIRPLPPVKPVVQEEKSATDLSGPEPTDGPASAVPRSDVPDAAGVSTGDADVISMASRRGALRRTWILGAGMAAAVALIVTLVWSPWKSPLSPTDAVVQASDARSYSLNVGDAKATVVRSASKHEAVIMTSGMQAPPQGKVYQLWLQFPDKGMVSAGFMSDDPNAPVLLQGDAAAATAAGITVEPAGGSEQPTSDPVAVISLA